MGQILIHPDHFVGFAMLKKCIHHFTATPFPMTVDPNLDIVITQFSHYVKLALKPSAVPVGLSRSLNKNLYICANLFCACHHYCGNSVAIFLPLAQK